MVTHLPRTIAALVSRYKTRRDKGMNGRCSAIYPCVTYMLAWCPCLCPPGCSGHASSEHQANKEPLSSVVGGFMFTFALSVGFMCYSGLLCLLLIPRPLNRETYSLIFSVLAGPLTLTLSNSSRFFFSFLNMLC